MIRKNQVSKNVAFPASKRKKQPQQLQTGFLSNGYNKHKKAVELP
ncbi:hypothetical protein [Virgibacillus senegalensis]|nr:hypothetical protein [Virgibacillus senegalensis]